MKYSFGDAVVIIIWFVKARNTKDTASFRFCASFLWKLQPMTTVKVFPRIQKGSLTGIASATMYD